MPRAFPWPRSTRPITLRRQGLLAAHRPSHAAAVALGRHPRAAAHRGAGEAQHLPAPPSCRGARGVLAAIRGGAAAAARGGTVGGGAVSVPTVVCAAAREPPRARAAARAPAELAVER